MYFSRLLLDPANADARRDLQSPYDMHRTLQRAFPGGEPEENRLLFRIEPHQHGTQGSTVLVQSSSERPDWSYLTGRSDGYALSVDGPKKVNPAPGEGQVLSFRLLGNPTKKRNGRRIALTDEEDYRGWLERKGRLHGFEPMYANASAYWINGDAQPGSDGYAKGNIPHFAVRFDGLLRVTDQAEMRDTLAAGIGPAKAFGFGLLSLARPQ